MRHNTMGIYPALHPPGVGDNKPVIFGKHSPGLGVCKLVVNQPRLNIPLEFNSPEVFFDVNSDKAFYLLSSKE